MNKNKDKIALKTLLGFIKASIKNKLYRTKEIELS